MGILSNLATSLFLPRRIFAPSLMNEVQFFFNVELNINFNFKYYLIVETRFIQTSISLSIILLAVCQLNSIRVKYMNTDFSF